ncbi:MAG: hypothetical protein EA399_14690 [Desulfovibrionales bacterium]|nr:MAG: hypothetical protein EA399_14690 [Desulfovibrionales bacterium]
MGMALDGSLDAGRTFRRLICFSFLADCICSLYRDYREIPHFGQGKIPGMGTFPQVIPFPGWIE